MAADFHILCGTPDCDWGFPIPRLSEHHLDACCAGFRQHCIERDRLADTDSDSHMLLDLVAWTLTLLKAGS
jgi:hypothetical protein